MPTVQEAAKRYGVTTAFMMRALAQLGYKGAQPEQPMSAAAIAQFDEKWGDKIRAARPALSTPTPDETRTAVARSRSVRRSAPHVMRIAHARVTAGRDSSGQRVKRLLDLPDAVHAIDAAGTNDGDPWNGEVVSGAVYFYDGSINSGPTAACGWVHMRAVLSDEFVPAKDPAQANQCPRCATAVADGKGFRKAPHERLYRSYFCEAYLRVRVEDNVTVKVCSLRDFHDGPHRAPDGAEWDIGIDDYVPSPDEVGLRITKAS